MKRALCVFLACVYTGLGASAGGTGAFSVLPGASTRALTCFYGVSEKDPAQAVAPPLPHSPKSLKGTRGLTSLSNVFVPKGQWVTGLSGSFSTHSNDNYTVVVIEGINSEGHTIKLSPMLGYAFGDNMVAGVRFGYSRTFLRIGAGGISMGGEDAGVNIKVDSYYSLRHLYEGNIFWRRYIPFGANRRFALFSEVQLSLGGSQAKFAADTPVRGTYETGFTMGLSVTPGLVAFVTNDMAFELNVGVMGVMYENVKQVHNQVAVGRRSGSMMSFKVNLFSIGLGMAFYL